MRLFLAINLPPATRADLARATAPLREAAPHLGWVHQEKLHLTLKFLGERPDSLVEPLRRTLARVAELHAAMPIELGGLGAFPNLRRPRVVWMAVEASTRLELLHHDLEVGCAELGLELEGRAFRPHLTLARVRERTPPEELRELSLAARTVSFRETIVVQSIDLMQSELGKGGSRYVLIFAAPLRGA